MSSDHLSAPRIPLESSAPSALQKAVHGADADLLLAAAADPALSEDLALALLQRNDLSPEILQQLARNVRAIKSRKVKLALINHLKTPRYVAMAVVRQLFTFDLMQVALTPVVPGDLKMAAEEALIDRLDTISSGERLTLARRASGRVAEALLLDGEPQVMHAALENARLTEAHVVRALMSVQGSAAFVRAVCDHSRWSLRREVRVALLCSAKTPVSRAIEFAQGLPPALLREILQNSHLPAGVKARVIETMAGRRNR